jgi:hypothetical protein
MLYKKVTESITANINGDMTTDQLKAIASASNTAVNLLVYNLNEAKALADKKVAAIFKPIY